SRLSPDSKVFPRHRLRNLDHDRVISRKCAATMVVEGGSWSMPYLYRTRRKDGTPHARWRFQYRDWQGKKRKATGYTSRSETEKLANTVQAEHDAIRKGLRPPPVIEEPPLPFDEVAEKYLTWGETQGGRRGRPWSKRHAEKRR